MAIEALLPLLPLVSLAGAFVVLGGLAAVLERRWPERPGAPLLSRARKTDWLYWPFSALVTGNLTRLFTMGAVGVAALALGYTRLLRSLFP